MIPLKVIILIAAALPLSLWGKDISSSIDSTDHLSVSPFSLKTNTLYWMALTPNLEAEFYLAKQFSINTEIQFAWWSSSKTGFCYELLWAGAEVRYWLKEKEKLQGHYIGVYGSGGMYDWMLDGNKDGFQGEFWSTGLSYGYVLPIHPFLNLEFGLSAGYIFSEYDRYERCVDCFQRKSRERIHWIGPTKVKIALVWRIPQKGGKR